MDKPQECCPALRCAFVNAGILKNSFEYSTDFFLENIFGIPGIGNMFVTSINLRDYNFFMAMTVFYTFIGLASGIIIDISYGIIDPRIRMGSKK